MDCVEKPTHKIAITQAVRQIVLLSRQILLSERTLVILWNTANKLRCFSTKHRPVFPKRAADYAVFLDRCQRMFGEIFRKLEKDTVADMAVCTTAL